VKTKGSIKGILESNNPLTACFMISYAIKNRSPYKNVKKVIATNKNRPRLLFVNSKRMLPKKLDVYIKEI